MTPGKACCLCACLTKRLCVRVCTVTVLPCVCVCCVCGVNCVTQCTEVFELKCLLSLCRHCSALPLSPITAAVLAQRGALCRTLTAALPVLRCHCGACSHSVALMFYCRSGSAALSMSLCHSPTASLSTSLQKQRRVAAVSVSLQSTGQPLILQDRKGTK